MAQSIVERKMSLTWCKRSLTQSIRKLKRIEIVSDMAMILNHCHVLREAGSRDLHGVPMKWRSRSGLKEYHMIRGFP
jgi:hypothetical protein